MIAAPRTRIAIVGAGAVGSTIAYAVMMRGLVHEIVLVDAVPGKAEAEAKDLLRGAAAEVIAAKSATNWAIGLAVERIPEAVVRGESAVLTVSALLADYHGIGGVCLSVPRVVERGGAGTTLPVPYDNSQLALLRRSAEILRQTASRVGF